MSLADLLEWNLLLFLLIFSRLAGMVLLAPVFGARGVPTTIKIALTGSLSLIMYPLVFSTRPNIPAQLYPFIALLIKEIFLGLAIGFVIYAFSAIIAGAGQLIDFQMGFSMGNSIDPVYGVQTPLTGNFHLVIATMILLATDAHHYLIAAMIKSYTFIPINPGGLANSLDFWIKLIGNVFSLSIQLALPVFGALLVADLGIGLLARGVPQLNIFSVIFPAKIMLGFILLILVIPLFGDTVTRLFNTDITWLFKLLQGWQHE